MAAYVKSELKGTISVEYSTVLNAPAPESASIEALSVNSLFDHVLAPNRTLPVVGFVLSSHAFGPTA